MTSIASHPEFGTPSFEGAERLSSGIEVTDELITQAMESTRGEPRDFGATPLDFSLNTEDQSALGWELRRLTSEGVPEDVPPAVFGFIHDEFMERYYHRIEANYENYKTSLRQKVDFKDQPDMYAMIERGEKGTASPAELLIVRQLLGIRSVELACLSHPYNNEERMNYLKPMRQAVKDGVELVGGEYIDVPEERYRAKKLLYNTFDDTNQLMGVLMTRKRTLGTLQDGTLITERSSFVLRTDDPTVVDDEMLQRILATDPKDPGWGDKVAQSADLTDLASYLLEADEHSLAIPISSTIYAHSPETTREIEERQRVCDAEAHIEKQRTRPHIVQLMLSQEALEAARREFNESKQYAPMIMKAELAQDPRAIFLPPFNDYNE